MLPQSDISNDPQIAIGLDSLENFGIYNKYNAYNRSNRSSSSNSCSSRGGGGTGSRNVTVIVGVDVVVVVGSIVVVGGGCVVVTVVAVVKVAVYVVPVVVAAVSRMVNKSTSIAYLIVFDALYITQFMLQFMSYAVSPQANSIRLHPWQWLNLSRHVMALGCKTN